MLQFSCIAPRSGPYTSPTQLFSQLHYTACLLRREGHSRTIINSMVVRVVDLPIELQARNSSLPGGSPLHERTQFQFGGSSQPRRLEMKSA
jgi:hypothetical protein